MRLLIALAAAALLSGCASTGTSTGNTIRSEARHDAALLLSWLEGDFNNVPALKDTERDAVEGHLPIQVKMRRLPSIPGAVYVEQARMDTPEQPYLQRVRQVRDMPDGTVAIAIFTLKDPDQLIGAWQSEERLAAITAEMLEPREGCDVILSWTGGSFKGSTVERNCPSSLRGSTYMTSETEVFEDGFVSWDRGYDDSGAQVWGAEKQPYLFSRASE